MNTVWVGLDNIYGNILSHKWHDLQFRYRFSQKQKSYKKVFQPLNNFYETLQQLYSNDIQLYSSDTHLTALTIKFEEVALNLQQWNLDLEAGRSTLEQ